MLMLISVTFAIAAPPGHRPLPPQVVSQAPGMHPLRKGRHSWWGIQMYDATLWIVGPQWSAAGTHELDLEPSRVVSADTLMKNAISEMRDLKVGDESKLKTWHAEMNKVIPNVRPGDQIVIFCPDTNRTLVYFNSKCPFRNLPESGKGRWGEGLTAEDIKRCRWLTPKLVAMIEFLEWTLDNHLRHPKFVALRDDRIATAVKREAR
jgi:hypothetical protein